ncbi:MAG: hypothetical protein U9Q69_02330 [Nanoarchaeota archaeon]|nr:hypothetical protein [Nanoarchaeota archaeon]
MKIKKLPRINGNWKKEGHIYMRHRPEEILLELHFRRDLTHLVNCLEKARYMSHYLLLTPDQYLTIIFLNPHASEFEKEAGLFLDFFENKSLKKKRFSKFTRHFIKDYNQKIANNNNPYDLATNPRTYVTLIKQRDEDGEILERKIKNILALDRETPMSAFAALRHNLFYNFSDVINKETIDVIINDVKKELFPHHFTKPLPKTYPFIDAEESRRRDRAKYASWFRNGGKSDLI